MNSNELYTPHWYPYYHLLFSSATQSWKAETIGAYQLLLNYEWCNGGLPNDLEELTTIARCSKKILTKVLTKFYLGEDGKYWNKKMEEIRAEQFVKYGRRAKAGSEGGKRKAENYSNATAMLEQSQSNAEAIKVKVKDKLLSKDNNGVSGVFQTPPPPPEKKEKTERDHRFINSPFYDFEKFKAEFIRLGDIGGHKAEDIDIIYYYNAAKDYSLRKASAKYANWVRAVRNWLRGDIEDRKNIKTLNDAHKQNPEARKFAVE